MHLRGKEDIKMTGRIAVFCAVSSVAAGVIFALIGGWDLALEALAIIMLLDYGHRAGGGRGIS